MFPLAGKSFPTSAQELTSAIDEALSLVFTLPETKGGGVSVTGGNAFPALKAVRLNLDGAAVSATEPPPKPEAVGKRHPGITVERLDISGQPILYQQTKLNLKVSASGLSFDFGRDKKGSPLLVLTEADEGKVEAKVTKEDVEALLLAAASAAAKQQGITVQDLQLELTSDGPRSLAAHVRVKAKKLMMSGVLVITGKLDVDDELNAAVSGLTCVGEGIVGSAAAGIVQKKLAAFDGTTVSLMAFSLGDVTLRDLKIVAKNTVQVSAAFGKEPAKSGRR